MVAVLADVLAEEAEEEASEALVVAVEAEVDALDAEEAALVSDVEAAEAELTRPTMTEPVNFLAPAMFWSPVSFTAKASI